MLRLLPRLAVALLFAAISGCALNPAVTMNRDIWSQTDKTVGVALVTLPKAAAHRVGGQGLLDQAINEAVTESLGGYLKQLDLAPYGEAVGEIGKRLQALGFKVVEFRQPLGTEALKDFSSDDKSRTYAGKDFRGLRQQYGVDRLVLLTVLAAGTQRSYYGFVPISKPVALLRGRGELIDLTNNEILWRENVESTAAIGGEWDQPPNYPNLTIAVQQNIRSARDRLVASLFSSAPQTNLPPAASAGAAPAAVPSRQSAAAAPVTAPTTTSVVAPAPSVDSKSGVTNGAASAPSYPRVLRGQEIAAHFARHGEMSANSSTRPFKLRVAGSTATRDCPSCNVVSDSARVAIKSAEDRVCMTWSRVTYPASGCFQVVQTGTSSFELREDSGRVAVAYAVRNVAGTGAEATSMSSGSGAQVASAANLSRVVDVSGRSASPASLRAASERALVKRGWAVEACQPECVRGRLVRRGDTHHVEMRVAVNKVTIEYLPDSVAGNPSYLLNLEKDLLDGLR